MCLCFYGKSLKGLCFCGKSLKEVSHSAKYDIDSYLFIIIYILGIRTRHHLVHMHVFMTFHCKFEYPIADWFLINF